MLIEDKPLQHWIDNFFGYGSWDAKLWFVAFEEGGGDYPEEVSEKINWFYREHPKEEPTLCDIRQLYRHVTARLDGAKAGRYKNLYEYRFDREAMLNGIWKNLIAFVHGYKGQEVPDLLAYQRQTLASRSLKGEALIKLYPLPSPHNHAWYYSWLDKPQFGFLRHRSSYQEHVFEKRIDHILQQMSANSPDVVLMYGMSDIARLKKAFQHKFPDSRFKMEKAIKQQVPQHHYAMCNQTRVIITTQIPTLRHNRVETGFDWEKFGKQVSSY